MWSCGTYYFRSRNLLGQRTRTPISGLQIFAQGLASGIAITQNPLKINSKRANVVSTRFESFRDKLGFRQRAGSLAGFGSKKHHINWDFGCKNLLNTHLWVFLKKKHTTQTVTWISKSSAAEAPTISNMIGIFVHDSFLNFHGGHYASGSCWPWNFFHDILCHLFNLIFHSPIYASSYHQGADFSCLFWVILSGHFWVFQCCLLIFHETQAHFDSHHYLPFQLMCYIWNGLFCIGMKLW